MSIKNNKKTKYISVLGMALALSLILGYIDSMLPFNVLGIQIKIGLANIVSLLLIFDQELGKNIKIKYSHIMLMAVMRVCILSIIRGNAVNFILSLSGCIVSHMVMFFVSLRARQERRGEALRAHLDNSIILTSIFAAISHNYTQIVVLIIINKNLKISLLFLPFLFISIITGFLTGLIANILIKMVKHNYFSKIIN